MKLSNYYSSEINHININYGGQNFNFNIAKEVKINEHDLEREIKQQPSRYVFLFILHKKLLTRFETLKQHRKSIYGNLYSKAKRRTSSNGRPYTEDACKHWVESHKEYKAITDKCISAREDADVIQGCVRAFEQKKDLLQTLSSNTRKERI